MAQTEPEITTDECIKIIEENHKFAMQMRKEEVETFKNNFTFEMDNQFRGFIKVNSTGKTYNFKTRRGMKTAFTKASFTNGAHFNQYIVGSEITGIKYW